MATPASRQAARPAVRIPEDALAGEIEFAITYIAACNPGRRLFDFGTITPEVVREEVASAIARMITERAEKGLSGMSLDTGSG